MSQYPPFLQEIKDMDPAFFGGITQIWDLAMTPGELDGKTKILIALALDALAGSREGVESVAALARKMGIKEGEINEALRLSYLVAANKALDTFASAMRK
ncbi:MAG: carboxymuconolactone decarboxylase family protein [Bacteroidota bacterium]